MVFLRVALLWLAEEYFKPWNPVFYADMSALNGGEWTQNFPDITSITTAFCNRVWQKPSYDRIPLMLCSGLYVSSERSFNCTVSQKTPTVLCIHNFAKCWSIFKKSVPIRLSKFSLNVLCNFVLGLLYFYCGLSRSIVSVCLLVLCFILFLSIWSRKW